MNEARIVELEIRLAYQEDLIQSLNQVLADQQKQLSKLEETCKLLHHKILSLAVSGSEAETGDERPPHY